MKKIITAAVISFLATSSAKAVDLYVGLDGLFTNATYKAISSNASGGPKNGDKQDGDALSVGGSAGLRFDLLNLMVSAETFYDHLDVSARSFEVNGSGVNSSDSINVNYRYGAKANVGFAILPRITPYLTYGMANVNYSNKLVSTGQSVGNSEIAPLYGVGLMVDLLMGFSVRASYDYQALNIRSAEGSDSKIKAHLGVAKLGVTYRF
jgi:opacity protein-like surface antigen